MISKAEERRVLVRFEDGDDLFVELGKAIKEHDIPSGIILCSIGMLRDVSLGFFQGKQKGYRDHALKGPLELVSMQGNIGTMNGKPVFHMHVCLADSDRKTFGGHLKKATVHVTGEMFIAKLDCIHIVRQKEEKTGLNGLFFKNVCE